MPSPVRFSEVERLFRKHGWTVDRVRGSHHVFKSPTGQVFIVPVHNKQVKYGYYRDAKTILGEP